MPHPKQNNGPMTWFDMLTLENAVNIQKNHTVQFGDKFNFIIEDSEDYPGTKKIVGIPTRIETDDYEG